MTDPAAPTYRDDAWLREQYVERGRTMAELSDECDCAKNTIRRWLNRHDIGTREHAQASHDGRLDDPEWLREQVEQGRGLRDIADAADGSHATVWRRCREFGIPTGSEASADD